MPVVAEKLADVEPEFTVTLPGSDNDPELLDSDTVPPVDLFSVTVQLDVPELPRLVGLHESPLTCTGVVSEIFAVAVVLFSDAVMVAVWSLLTVPAVAEKPAVVEPEFTVTLPGTDNDPELLDSATVPPVDFVSVTVQLDVPLLDRLVGLHERLLTAIGATSEILAVFVVLFSDAVMVAV